MRYVVRYHLAIDASSPEAARLWAEQVARQLHTEQPAIIEVGEIEVERDEDADDLELPLHARKMWS